MAYINKNQVCKIHDCSKPAYSRSWCQAHYTRWWSHGITETLKVGRPSGYKVPAEVGQKISKVKTGMKYTRHVKTCVRPNATGATHYNWKGGISSSNKLERQQFKATIHTLVLTRDDYTCQVCSTYGGYLHVDHIKSWSKYPELRFELNNCRTVCRACHYYLTFKRKLPLDSTWGLHGLKGTV